MTTVMYGAAIQQAIASGDLAKMKKVAKMAEQKLAEEGNVAIALEILRVEIARLEKRERG